MEPDDRLDEPESTTDLLAAFGAVAEDTAAEDTISEAEPPACRLIGISLAADGHEILQEVNLDIPAHACTVIMGPSGSGKSTLLKTAAGLLVPDTGLVEILGTDPNRAIDRELERL